jgi:predicted dehydrogenase
LTGEGQILRPKLAVKDGEGKVVQLLDTNVPDQVSTRGLLESGAHLSFYLRRGPAFKGTLPLDWRIYGEKGELRMSGTSTAYSAFNAEVKLELEDYEKDAVEEVSYGKIFEDLPVPARNVGAVYEAYAKDDKEHYADGARGLEIHQTLDEIAKGFPSVKA